MKQFSLLFFTSLYFSANCQITKGNWLVGGSGSFSSTKNTYSSVGYFQTSDVLNIKLSPNVGYFPLDKLAVGIRPSFSKNKAQVTTSSGGYTNTNRFEIGPYARYYFLQTDKPFNILADIGYQIGIYRFKPDKGTNNTFSALAGPVIYFNSTVGIEFLAGYYKREESIETEAEVRTKEEGMSIQIGLQIHLVKE